ncbi:DEAD box ATP-dependent RNA helicase family member protein [Theileria equi strain WA]|uniref:ATP-dependent RNA helicase n=1 Tax=Theileria equi strain WA TaxID=1537102 RepID=L0B170_THEEQ|nr:DEAD box ATP-dependent RNA helicase family member protein [Theileria equi strain WA]AFZ81570.1 DEAD box ATP-dependent RNA helicase family member protein [Theileria equi strain WA]|eukprot:XP_004831236.1 DEAD box ATP-dependent RNA helicase family member protein [Theileria equi strain WA]
MSSYSSESFSSLNIHASLIDVLSKLGITTSSSAQSKFIRAAGNSQGVILQSKSGTGKTVSFCIFALNKIISSTNSDLYDNRDFLPFCSRFPSDNCYIYCGEVVILVPTRELALQIYHFLTLLSTPLKSIKISLNTGGIDLLGDIKNIKDLQPNVIIATPGRLKTILKQYKLNNGYYKHSYVKEKPIFKIHTFVLDEADLLLDDHFFIQTKQICDKLINPFVQVIAVSATFIKPQLNILENMVFSIDDKFKSTFINMAPTLDTVFSLLSSMAPGFEYSYRLLSRSISSFDDLIYWISKYERKFSRIIVSASHVNRINLSLSSQSMFENVPTSNMCYIDNDICELSDIVKHTKHIENEDIRTPVLQGVTFYLAKILDAPTIVMQVGLKLKCILSILSYVPYKKCIIFCNQSHSRIQSYRMLQAFGFQCYVSSSRLSHKERMTMLNDVFHMDKVVIICTDIMCRGICFSGVDLVINMDMAMSKEVFLHRSGRVGRFGAKGLCMLLKDSGYKLEFVDNDGVWTFDPVIYEYSPLIRLIYKTGTNFIETFTDSLLDCNSFFSEHQLIGAILPSGRIDLTVENSLLCLCFEVNYFGYAEISIRHLYTGDNPYDSVILKISGKRDVYPKLKIYMPTYCSRMLDCTDFTLLSNTKLHIIISDSHFADGLKINGALITLFPDVGLFRTLVCLYLNKYLDLKFIDSDDVYSQRQTHERTQSDFLKYSQCVGTCEYSTDHIPKNMLDNAIFMLKYYSNIAEFDFNMSNYIRLYELYTNNIALNNLSLLNRFHVRNSPLPFLHEHYTKWKSINKNFEL